MSTLIDLRVREKTLQGELQNMRGRIEQAEAKIVPLRTALSRMEKELTDCQREIISALQSKLNKADAA